MTDRPLRVVTRGELPPSFPRVTFGERIDLRAAQTEDELRSLLREADVLYSGQVPDTVPAESPSLAWIQLPSAGADHLRALPVWQSDVIITSSKGMHAVPMSEHLFALLLALVRTIPGIARGQAEHEWRQSALEPGELRGKTMAIVGWGKIGEGVAHLARAFGMRVIGTRFSLDQPRIVSSEGPTAYADAPWLEPVDLPPDVVYPAGRLGDVLAESDVVVVILPLTDRTRHLFDTAAFRCMKRDALFFNMGRGVVVEEDALVRALREGWIAGAGLDVFEEEPLPGESPLWDMPNVIVSPHLGGFSPRTPERTAHFFAVNLARYVEGQPLLNVVDRTQEY